MSYDEEIRHLDFENENADTARRYSRFDRHVSRETDSSNGYSRSRSPSRHTSKERDRSRSPDSRRSKSHSERNHYSKSYREHRSKSKSKERRSKSKSKERSSKSKKRSSKSSRHKSSKKSKKRSKHDISDSESDHSSRRTIKELKSRLKALERQRGNSPAFSFNPSNYQNSNYSDDERFGATDNLSDHDEADFASILNEGIDGAKKGPILKKEAMALVSKVFDKEPENAMVKSIKDKYLDPENCENLSGKTVNAEIYRNLPAYMKKKDFCLKGIQGAIATASTANLRLIDELASMKARGIITNEVANSLYQYACDSTKMLAKGYSDISVYRKFALKSQVQPSYQQLCAKRTFGSMLFGNDLAKEVKNIAEESKIMRQFNKVPPQPVYAQRYHPYADRNSKNGQYRGRGNFRPQYGQYRGRTRPYRGRGKVPAAQNQAPNTSAQ